jgi:DNA-binding transcriptional ArsR family regulator
MSTVPMKPPVPDYEAEDVLVVSEPEQLRALADDLRARIVGIRHEHARSTTDLAGELGIPKGTVGHHLKVLEKAGLIHVVRTRQVRALTEKYYGRVARLFVIRSKDDPELVATVAAGAFRQAAAEIERVRSDTRMTQALVHTRLNEADARRFMRRLDKLVDDFRARESSEGEMYALALGFYPLEHS